MSVIIPVLNEATRILDAVESARQAGAHEIIVVDGGSHDGTPAIAAKRARVVNSIHQGRAVQQNIGAQAASGDILLFLHADCRLASQSLREIDHQLRQSPNAVGGCFCQRIDAPGWAFRAVEIGNRWRARFLRCPYGDQAIFVRTEVFRSLGGFPELPLMEDLFFSRKLRKMGRMLLLKSCLNVSARRWQQQGVFRQTIRNWTLVSAAKLGVSPAKLTRFYPNDR